MLITYDTRSNIYTVFNLQFGRCLQLQLRDVSDECFTQLRSEKSKRHRRGAK